ncbi:MAG: hypothetical protein LC734_09900 [Acidobacteria bacterium]|nr:hypothetical protein [Acidobacteriota bacterium]
MEREFEKFRGGPTQPTHERIHVTMVKGNKICLNKHSYKLFGKPEAVYLYFSRKSDIIALEAASPRLPESFPVRANRLSTIGCMRRATH